MQKSDQTKLNIYNSLVSLAVSSREGEVSVTDVSQESGVSRRTFYYHFDDIADTATWGFFYDLSQSLTLYSKTDSSIALVYPDNDADGKYRELPYYVRKTPGVRTIDGSDFFKALHGAVRKHGPFYSVMTPTESGRQFLGRLASLYLPQICFDIRFIAGGRPMKQRVVEMLASDFVQTRIVSCFNPNTDHPFSYPSDEKGLENIAHDYLKLEVNEYLKANSPRYVIKDLRKDVR